MKTISQEELDWFVEGEMDPSERHSLFARMDGDPGAWKRCALALLERDALSCALQRKPNKREPLQQRPPCVCGDRHAIPAVETRAVSLKDALDNKKNAAGRKKRSAWLTALAGMLLVAVFSLGYWFGDYRGPAQASIENNSDVTRPNSLVEKERSPFIKLVSNLDPATIAQVNAAVARINVPDREVIAVVSLQYKDRQIVLPVIESEQLARSWAELPAPALPAAMAKKFLDSGFALQPNRQFVSLPHKDGTNEVQAFNMLDFRFVGKAVF